MLFLISITTNNLPEKYLTIVAEPLLCATHSNLIPQVHIMQAAKKEITFLRTMISLGLNNLLLLTDSYKVLHEVIYITLINTHAPLQVTHWVQYPKDSATVYSYFESRGGKHKEVN